MCFTIARNTFLLTTANGIVEANYEIKNILFMKNFNVFEWTALVLLIVGGVNWGMVGAFNIDLVSSLFGDMTVLTRVVYGLVGLSAVYLTLTSLMYSSETSSVGSKVVHP